MDKINVFLGTQVLFSTSSAHFKVTHFDIQKQVCSSFSLTWVTSLHVTEILGQLNWFSPYVFENSRVPSGSDPCHSDPHRWSMSISPVYVLTLPTS